MQKNIPTYTLNNISKHGLVVERITKRFEDPIENPVTKGIHRDSHYIFMFVQSCEAKMMVDFKTFKLSNAGVFCVLPGQVHQSLGIENISGWFVAANVDFIPDYVRTVFEESLVAIKPVSINKEWSDKLQACVKLLHTSYSDELMTTKEGVAIVQSLLNAYTGMFASIYAQTINREKTKESRAMQLTRQFRILARQKYKTLKSPSRYAEALNISSVYLTEIVKDATGKSVSYWIQQEILTEAKRLLFYTDMTVKEIACELGYEDHAYFSRLFSKLSGQSALAFRKRSRK
ncbi:AraC family transcriptional regulator [Arachidicoccus ginsenosidimutans]|uniref:helix-turn-helix domain-containing protein n=1 Tax=Arachidicoccus sp. BS20 TaxID=1850526 RepID=UPI0007F05329|nr:helix-turn-helix domain-containing protein [Arachidicoccus sp. BS20]ANI88493.1 AraC family transcriptional regulator [Arachidicoccus sp. BS20]